MQEEVKPPPAKDKLKAFVEFLKALPFGRGPAWVIEHGGGFIPLIYLLVGGVVVVVVFFMGWAPELLISSYRISAPTRNIGPKPQNLKTVLIDAPDWLQPQIAWLESEGQMLKTQGVIVGYQICTVFSELQSTSENSQSQFPNFAWEIWGERDCDVKGFAFRRTKEGLFQPLDIDKSSGGPYNPTMVGFVVPQGSLNGESLMGIVRASWKAGSSPLNCGALQSHAR